MSRLSPLTEADLSAEQQAVLDAIRTGPRGSRGLGGPFGVYARAPSIGHEAQALGAAVRFRASELAENVKEVAICTVGAFYRAKFEFAAHRELAVAAGVDPEEIDKLRVGELPSFKGAEDLSYRVATSLLNLHRLDSNTYTGALGQFGEEGLIELVTIIGYYCMVALTLNAFEVPLTSGMEDPFPDG
jgi:4-carboxymuconolactone decarboxylase